MKLKIFLWVLISLNAWAVEPLNAADEMQKAITAMNSGSYQKALQYLSRIQVFCYSDAERMPEALYYETLIEQKTGITPKVSAIEELCRLYPESPWCSKARAEFATSDSE